MSEIDPLGIFSYFFTRAVTPCLRLMLAHTPSVGTLETREQKQASDLTLFKHSRHETKEPSVKIDALKMIKVRGIK